ncbi:MAG: 4Fe-4S binding protein [Desulfobacterales bacterium]|jgi:Fe-S-cluster-containing hydrogenase component 2|nr:4Fe-4S binding protein [Desulfobacterales bacterium]
MTDVYTRLREHLDSLPAGFPATADGVELRILKRLFNAEEAALAVHVGMKLEPAAAIAARAGLPEAEAGERLRRMARRGLIFSIEAPDRPPVYMAAQFVIGIWEYHVNELDAEFVRDMDAYIPILSRSAFGRVPQLRTIPVGASISAGLETLPYEEAEALVRRQTKFLVAPCICRREHQIKGEGCGKLEEACLIFGWGADYYARNGLGRYISLAETLEILKQAEAQGLVLQPSNAREIVNICLCCGDCCQVLKHLKRMPQPAAAVASAFIAALDAALCTGCEACLERCQMDALRMADGRAALDADRCIGCGLCVAACPGGALSLVRKPAGRQPPVPKDMREAFLLRAKSRMAEPKQ